MSAPTRYPQPVEALITRRKSVRTYSARPVPRELQDRIRDHLASLKGPFGGSVRFELLEAREVAERQKVRLGTYGWILGASLYVACVCGSDRSSILQTGFQLEDALLGMTAMGLGTCWLAGTFNRGAFARAMRPADGEIIPAVTPIGWPAALRSPIDFALKPIPGHKARVAWGRIFFNGSFSEALSAEEAGAWRAPLEMVRIAPSASNRQPWRVVRRDGVFHFYLEHDPLYGHRYGFDIQHLDMGIAAFHFQASAEERGLAGAWVFKDPELRDAPVRAEYIASWSAA